jgi:hypothetical protein
VRPEAWNPAATGSGDAWTLSRSLGPLAAVKHQLTVVSGTNIDLTDYQHPQGASNIYTGTNYSPADTSKYSQATPRCVRGRRVDGALRPAAAGFRQRLDAASGGR